MSDEEKKDLFESTVVTSIEKLGEIEADQKAYILFLAGPLQGKLFLLNPGQTVIGRSDDVDIPIQDNRISRRHFAINVHNGKAELLDLSSTNGTYVNGTRAEQKVLEDGDKIQISSSTILKFAYGDKGERMFHEEFYQMANFDAVTGANNKQAFIKRFQEEFSYAKRNKLPMSLIMFDIDFFKKVNDTYGHMAGDYILKRIAEKANDTVRGEDIMARYGGEEFAIILRGSAMPGAIKLAERIRESVASEIYEFEGNNIPVTISLGVATFEGDNYETQDELMAAADARLYHSKENGRNQVSAS